MGSRRANEDGFNLVELLVVVVIISLLASIMVPVFFNQREKAWQASTESALKNAATALNSAAIDRGGSYEGISVPELVAKEGLKYDERSLDLLVAAANASNYCLEAYHETWAQTMYYDSAEAQPSQTDCSGNY